MFGKAFGKNRAFFILQKIITRVTFFITSVTCGKKISATLILNQQFPLWY